MKDLNVVILLGRLTRDAEVQYTSTGMAIAKFAVAVNRSVKDGDTWKDEASFFDCTMFGKRAEVVAQYLTKGKQIGVSGSLKQDRWEKDGQNRSKVVVIVDDVQLLGGKREEA